MPVLIPASLSLLEIRNTVKSRTKNTAPLLKKNLLENVFLKKLPLKKYFSL